MIETKDKKKSPIGGLLNKYDELKQTESIDNEYEDYKLPERRVFNQDLKQEPEQELYADKDWLGKTGEDIKQGAWDFAEMGLRGVRALPGGEEIGGTDKENGWLDKGIDWIDETRDELPDHGLSEDGTPSWFHDAMRSVTSSFASGAAGALAGGKTGLMLGGGPWGAAAGAALGFGVQSGLFFGASTADESYAEAKEKGLDDEKATEYAIGMGVTEGGIEGLANAAEFYLGKGLGGSSKVAKNMLKRGARDLFKLRLGNIIKTGAATGTTEAATEMATAGVQNELSKGFGLSEESTLESMKRVAGPSFVAGLLFTPIAVGANWNNRKRDAILLVDQNADKKERLKAAENVAKEYENFDKRAANMWRQFSTEAIENGEPVNLELSYSELNERINNLKETAKYTDKGKETLEVLEAAAAQKKPQEKEEVTEEQKSERTFADIMSEQEALERSQSQIDTNVPFEEKSGSQIEPRGENGQLYAGMEDTQEDETTLQNIMDQEAVQKPEGVSEIEESPDSLPVINEDSDIGEFNISRPSKKNEGGYKRFADAQKKKNKIEEEGYNAYLAKNENDEFLVVTDRKYSQTEPVQGLRPDQVETEVRTEIGDQFERLKNKGTLEIVENEEGLQGEPLGEIDGRPAGYYHNGKITLISNNIGKDQAYNVFMHEGVHKMLDSQNGYKKQTKRIFNEFKNLKSSKDGAIANIYKIVPGNTPKERIDEEAFAYFMQDDTNRNHSLYRRTVATVKDYLQRLGINAAKLNEQDIAYLAAKSINKNLAKTTKTSNKPLFSMDGGLEEGRSMQDIMAEEQNSNQPLQASENNQPMQGYTQDEESLSTEPTGPSMADMMESGEVGFEQDQAADMQGRTFADVMREKNPDPEVQARVNEALEKSKREHEEYLRKEALPPNTTIPEATGKTTFDLNGREFVTEKESVKDSDIQEADSFVFVGEINRTNDNIKGAGRKIIEENRGKPTHVFDPTQNRWFYQRKVDPKTIDDFKETGEYKGKVNLTENEEVKYEFVPSAPPGMPMPSTFLYADTKYHNEGNALKELERMEKEYAGLYDEDAPAVAPDNVDDPSAKQAQLQRNSENAIRSEKADFYRSQGKSEVADNMMEDDAPVSADWGDVANYVDDASREDMDEERIKEYAAKKSSNTADIINEIPQDISESLKNNELSLTYAEKPAGFDDLKPIGTVKSKVWKSLFGDKTEKEIVHSNQAAHKDKLDQYQKVIERIQNTNRAVVNRLYNEMLNAKGNKFLNQRMVTEETKDRPAHKSFEEFERTREVITVKDAIINDIKDLAKFYDFSSSEQFFSGLDIKNAESYPDFLFDLMEHREQIREIAKGETIGEDDQYEIDVEEAKAKIFRDDFGRLVEELTQDNPNALRDFSDLLEALVKDETSESTISFLKERIIPSVLKAEELASNGEQFVFQTDEWNKVLDRLNKKFPFVQTDRVSDEFKDFMAKDIVADVFKINELEKKLSKEGNSDLRQELENQISDLTDKAVRLISNNIEYASIDRHAKDTKNFFVDNVFPELLKANKDSIAKNIPITDTYPFEAAIDRIYKKYGNSPITEKRNYRSLLRVLDFVNRDRTPSQLSDVVDRPADAVVISEEEHFKKTFPYSKKATENKEDRYLDKVASKLHITDVAHDNVNVLLGGTRSWGFEKNMNLNIGNAEDILIMLKYNPSNSVVGELELNNLLSSMTPKQEVQVAGILHRSLPDLKEKKSYTSKDLEAAVNSIDEYDIDTLNAVKKVISAVKSDRYRGVTNDFLRMSHEDKLDTVNVMVRSLKLIQDIWEQPVFYHENIAEIREGQDTPQIDAQEYINEIGRTENVASFHTIANVDNFHNAVNFDHRERQKDILSLVVDTGLITEQEYNEVLQDIETLQEGDLDTKEKSALENNVAAKIIEWKVALAKRALSTGMFMNNNSINELSNKYKLDAAEVKRTYLKSVDNQDFYRRVSNMVDEKYLDKFKELLNKKIPDTNDNLVQDISTYLTDGFNEKQLEAFKKKKTHRGPRRERLAVKAAIELDREIKLKGLRKAEIERIKLNNEQQVTISDVVRKKEKLSEFEQELQRNGAVVTEFLNSDKQQLYENVSKILGADLTVVADTRQHDGEQLQGMRSRYIPAQAKGEKGKFIVNIKDERPFHSIFADIAVDHLFNTLNDTEMRRLARRVGRLTGNTAYKDMPTTSETPIKAYADQSVYTPPNKIDQYRNVAKRMGIADMLKDVLVDRAFFADLAGEYEGNKVASQLIHAVTSAIDQLDSTLQKDIYSASHDTIGALSPHDLNEFKQLVLELFVDDGLLRRGHQYDQMNSSDERLYTMNGFYSIAELQQIKGQIQKGGKEATKRMFKDSPRTKKAIMDMIEGWVEKAKQYIKKHKPRGFIDDLLADPEAMRLASMVQHGSEQKLTEIKYQILQPYKEAFSDLSEKEMKRIHDRVVRGLDNVNGEVTQVGSLDLTKEEDIQTALEFGMTNDMVEAFQKMKEVSDDLYTQLKEIYPDLKKANAHYGQSIRWMKDGRFKNEEFDFIAGSQLEGSEHFLKEKNRSKTTPEIEEGGLKYRTIHPLDLFTDYVYEAQKIINTYNMGKEGIISGHAKAFTSHQAAKNAGFHEVDDPAFQRVFNSNKQSVFMVSQNGNPLLDEDGGRLYFPSRAEADRYAADLTGITSVEEITHTDKMFVGYSVNKRLGKSTEEIAVLRSREDADALAKQYEDAGFEIFVSERFEQTQDTSVNQVYFSEDLAKMLRTVVSKDSFKNFRIHKLTGRHLLQFKHASTAIEFAFSLFHAFTIANEAMASEMTIRQNRATGKINKLKASNPFTALKHSLNDATDIKVLLEEIMREPELVHNEVIVKKFGELLNVDNPDVAMMVQHFFNVGGRFKMDRSERHGSHYYGEAKYLPNPAKLELTIDEAKIVKGKNTLPGVAKTMVESVKKTRDDLAKRYPDKEVSTLMKTASFTAFEMPSAWLMESTIPKLKMATWFKEFAAHLERDRDKIISGQTTTMGVAHDTMKFVEDRFGEVNWKSQWMDKSVKDSLIFLFRSFTWFTGSWKGVTKAGFDYTRLGWYKLKGEKYELTTKGQWGINAVISHFVLAGMITAMYKAAYALEDEVPDDEETDLLTKLMFPRYDPLDPKARFTVPSYVTEAYKIFHHIGVMGDHPQPWKLISGRFNTFIGNGMEAFNGRTWDGVVTRDSSEALPKQAFDSALHIMKIAPISISSALNKQAQQGFDPLTLTFSLMGLTTAPAVSLHSDAVNKAYQLRREQFSGLTREPGEKRHREAINRAGYAYSQGNKEPLKKMLREGDISQQQFKNAITRLRFIDGKENPAYVNELTSAVKGLTIEAAIEVWAYMSDREKNMMRPLILNKYHNVIKRKTRPRNEIGNIRNELKVSGIL